MRNLAESVQDGASSEAVQARVEALAVSSSIWTLQVSCLRYCRFVHGYHVHEDDDALRRGAGTADLGYISIGAGLLPVLGVSPP